MILPCAFQEDLPISGLKYRLPSPKTRVKCLEYKGWSDRDFSCLHFFFFFEFLPSILTPRLTAPQSRVGDFCYEASGAIRAKDESVLELYVTVDDAFTVDVVQPFGRIGLQPGHEQHRTKKTIGAKSGRHVLFKFTANPGTETRARMTAASQFLREAVFNSGTRAC